MLRQASLSVPDRIGRHVGDHRWWHRSVDRCQRRPERCIAATVIKSSGSLILGVAAGLACGTAIGFLNGLMVTLLRLPPFIATYGMLWVVLAGITFWYKLARPSTEFLAFSHARQRVRAGIPVPCI